MGKEQAANGDDSVFLGSSLIPLINKVQDIFAAFSNSHGIRKDDLFSKIKLPQVAVIGSQSSGKSSVLEALVGRDFLPRGSGICTRCPLVLQLQNLPVLNNGEAVEWGEFLHLSGNRKFYDFAEIRREIQAETEKKAGLNKGVSCNEIRLKIFSPRVLNMTLIDLPGITKVPVGDQPSDIEARIRELIMQYIRPETCIILAVSPANSDLATSDALKIAREVDPTGSRTIGVITKLDIMDKGTDASDFLLGKAIPLHLGYVGVVNRCQQDINDNCRITDALANEEKFFLNHAVYSALSNCGIRHLATRLNQILEQHIRIMLPHLKKDLNSEFVAVQKMLNACQDLMDSKMEKGSVLTTILTKYCQGFSEMVDGRFQYMPTQKLSGGARIYYIFQSIFATHLEGVDPFEELDDDAIQIAIQNASGPRTALFVPEVPFEILIRRQIARLLDPCLQCLRLVREELIKISRICESIEMRQFPPLKSRVEGLILMILHDGEKAAEKMIRSMIEMEMDYINTSHPSFIGGKQALEMVMHQVRASENANDGQDVPEPEMVSRSQSNIATAAPEGTSTRQRSLLHSVNGMKLPVGNSTQWFGLPSMFSSRVVKENSTSRSHRGIVDEYGQASATNSLNESLQPCTLRSLEREREHEVEINVIKLLVNSYFRVIKNNILDFVPKAIMHYLVNNTRRNLLCNLMNKLHRQELFEELLREDDEVVKKRKNIQELFLVLQKAVLTLDEVEADFLLNDQASMVTIHPHFQDSL